MTKTIKNLVFKGGGVKGIAYVGALKELYALADQKVIDLQLQGVAGTSAGAITACLVALGFSPEQIDGYVSAMNLPTFEDHENILKTFEFYGMHPGNTFLGWLEDIFPHSPLNTREHPLNGQSSFTDLKNAGGPDLHVFACDIYTHEVAEFCVEKTPDIPVAEAVRASMSIPLFFNAWQFSNGKMNGHLYVDGGMAYNYPIYTFDRTPGSGMNETTNWETLGFWLEDVNGAKPVNAFGHYHWVKYVINTFETMMDAQSLDFHFEPEQKERTVIIDDLGVSATDFNLSDEMKQKLKASGQAAVTEFFKVAVS